MIAINYFALVVAALVAMAIGWFWYSPFGFGRQWMKLRGVHDDMHGSMPARELIVEFVSVLVTLYVLDLLIIAFGAFTVQASILLALVVWLGFYVTTYLSEVLWEKKPFGVFLINAGQRLVTLVAVALILGLWQ